MIVLFYEIWDLVVSFRTGTALIDFCLFTIEFRAFSLGGDFGRIGLCGLSFRWIETDIGDLSNGDLSAQLEYVDDLMVSLS